MPMQERASIISNIQYVNKVISFDDSDDSACQAIKWILDSMPEHNSIFANGGDRTNTNTLAGIVLYALIPWRRRESS